MNYMLLCFSIISYTIKHQDKILNNFSEFINIGINDIVFDTYYKEFQEFRLVEELQYYFEKRKSHFYNKTSNGDFVANEDEFNYKYRYFNWNSSNKTKTTTSLKDKFKPYSQYAVQALEQVLANAEPRFNGVDNNLPLGFRNGVIGDNNENVVEEFNEIEEDE